MTDNQIKIRNIILQLVEECTRCEFHLNGKALPFFGSDPKYLMIGEAPHTEEIKLRSPFVGDSGNRLWDALYSLIGLVRDDFIIFNSVLCKPTIVGKQTVGKPTKSAISSCFIKRTNVLTYLSQHFDIKHILVLGNYARYIFTDKMNGIDGVSGESDPMLWDTKSFILTYCLHPASSMYNPNNKTKFEESIKSFGKIIKY